MTEDDAAEAIRRRCQLIVDTKQYPWTTFRADDILALTAKLDTAESHIKTLERMLHTKRYDALTARLSTVKGERDFARSAWDGCVETVKAYEAQAVALTARLSRYEEALVELQKMLHNGWPGTGVLAMQNVVDAALTEEEE